MTGRFQTHTVASEGAELDDTYQKTVADIEEQTQRSGWLFGRGAFDKADLQYLRDFNSSLRYQEVEIEDKERELWERERARVEAETAAAAVLEQAAALKRRSSGGLGGAGFHGGVVTGPAAKGGPVLASRPAPLLLPVKVKLAGSRQQVTAQRQAASPSESQGPACKRPKTDADSAGSAGPLSPASVHAASESSELLRRSGSTGIGNGTAASSHGGGGSSAAAGPGSGPVGLASLLGGYGSEDEDSSEGGEQDGAKEDGCHGRDGSAGEGPGACAGPRPAAPTVKLPPPVGLLNPEELLSDPRVIEEGLLATRPVPQAVQGGDTWDSGEASSGSESD